VPCSCVLSGFALAIALLKEYAVTSSRVLLHLFLGAGGAVAYGYTHKGQFRKAAWWLTASYWIGVSFVTIVNGGLRGPNLVNYPWFWWFPAGSWAHGQLFSSRY